MYTQYQKSCKQEADRLLEGVFMEVDDDEDDEMDELSLDPLEQLDLKLSQFVDIVCGGSNSMVESKESVVMLCMWWH